MVAFGSVEGGWIVQVDDVPGAGTVGCRVDGRGGVFLHWREREGLESLESDIPSFLLRSSTGIRVGPVRQFPCVCVCLIDISLCLYVLA